MQKTKSGFTIVELLIVIVIIGILAAITIVAYNGIQDRARISSVSSGLSQSAKKLKLYQVDNPDTYPAAAGTSGIDNLAAVGITNSSDVTYQYSSSANTYCLTATNGTTSYKISSTSATPTAGGCAGHSQGGVAAITNLVPNPSLEANTTGWSYRWYGTAGGAGNNTRPTTGGLYGSAYLRKTWTAAGAAADNGFNNTSGVGQVTVTAGANYLVSGSMRTNRSDYSARIGVSWYDTNGTQVGTTTWYNGTTLSANTWQRISQSVTAPTGATSLIVMFSNGNSLAWAIGDTLDFDGAMVNNSANANYADGNTTDWAWNGTINNSTSTGPPQ